MINLLVSQSMNFIHLFLKETHGEVTEKRMILIILDKIKSLGKEYIGTVSLIGFGLPIVPVGIIKIIIAPIIRTLGDAAATMTNHFMKSSIFRTEGVVVAQVPFAKHSIDISILSKYLGQDYLILEKKRTTGDGMKYVDPVGVPPRH